mmetsp:Transcript_58765/g.134812  ORF Transcript_58765/g.134812 Transcript_58765/m.134812 type:complete len:234 (-) Transcript_58765:435-1136(-)
MITSPSAISLASGYVQTRADSSCVGDLFFFLCNTHLLLIAFLAHSQHPHRKADYTMEMPLKWRVLLQSCAFAFFCSAIAISLSAWHDEVPNDWPRLEFVLRTVSDWPFTLCTLLQVLWDLSNPIVGVYLEPGFDEQPLLWRWSCGYPLLACSACTLIPSNVCMLLGMTILIACVLLAPIYRAGESVLFAALQWLQLFALSKLAALFALLPLISLLFCYLRLRQPRGFKQAVGP